MMKTPKKIAVDVVEAQLDWQMKMKKKKRVQMMFDEVVKVMKMTRA